MGFLRARLFMGAAFIFLIPLSICEPEQNPESKYSLEVDPSAVDYLISLVACPESPNPDTCPLEKKQEAAPIVNKIPKRGEQSTGGNDNASVITISNLNNYTKEDRNPVIGQIGTSLVSKEELVALIKRSSGTAGKVSQNPTTSNSEKRLQNAANESRGLSSTESAASSGSGSKGHSAGTPVNIREGFVNDSGLDVAQGKINKEIEAVPKALEDKTLLENKAPLEDTVRNSAVNGLINSARNSIFMPPNSSNLTQNPLYGKVLNDDSGFNVDQSLSSLVKDDLQGKDLRENFGELRDIALSKSFQENAAKFIGLQNLNDFNLAALGAEILMENDSTATELLAINNSLGSPYEKSIAKFGLSNPKNALAKASENFSIFKPEDWIEMARNLTDSNKRMLRPANMDLAKGEEGRKQLDKLLVDLKNYKSLDLLNSVTLPMDNFIVGWTKEAREKILLALGRMRSVPDNGLEHDSFKKKAKELHRELLSETVMAVFFDKFSAFYNDDSIRAIWRVVSPENYNSVKRSLGVIRFSLAFNGLRKKNFDKVPHEPLPYLVGLSIQTLNDEQLRKKKLKDKEKLEDSVRLAEKKKPIPTLEEE